MEKLRTQLRQIDHKGYKAYKTLEGEYNFGTYRLCIDHVQGDPFATPSRVRICYRNKGNINPEFFQNRHRRTAVEDYLLRRLTRTIRAASDGTRKGSGKSGIVTVCRAGQEILERSSMKITEDWIEARIEVGFPAYGRTIAAGELMQILFELLPNVAERTFHIQKTMLAELEQTVSLADDQQFIREELERHELLPHRGTLRGMGIRKGITVIAGGGFHGKSTLLKALERGVYNHIAGDGREYVITDRSAFKLRAEEGRCIHEVDISMFINHLPTKADTTRFSTENASGSTSQSANTVEALAAGSKVLLIDEDTSATNFMVRDDRMAQLVSDEKEPIIPFIRKIRSLYRDLGISTVLVAGSSGDYLSAADTVLQMDCYKTLDVTEKAKQLTVPLTECRAQQKIWIKKPVRNKTIEKVRVHGWDTLSLDRDEIDLRYLEQIVDESQTAALAYIMQYILGRLANGKKSAAVLAMEAAEKLEKGKFDQLLEGLYAAAGLRAKAGGPDRDRALELTELTEKLRSMRKFNVSQGLCMGLLLSTVED